MHRFPLSSWLVARERWLPALAGVAWWITFYPGFFGDDSLINLTEARSGAFSVWFTAWWVYLVDALSLGTRAIPLLTFVGVLTLEYAAYLWIATVFPKGPARAITVLVMSFTPLIGAMGIQVAHDVAATAGLLLCAAVATRVWTTAIDSTPLDYATLVLAMPLIATRHNGMPTVAATAAGLLLVSGARRWRPSAALVAAAAGAAVITYGATRAAGHTESVHPVQTVEWLMGDISCVLTKEGVEPTAEEWSTLTRIADRSDWPQERACWVMNPILASAVVRCHRGRGQLSRPGRRVAVARRALPGEDGECSCLAGAVVSAAVCDRHLAAACWWVSCTRRSCRTTLAWRWQFPALATRARATWSGRGMHWHSSSPTPPCG